MRKAHITILLPALLACLAFAVQSELTPREILDRSLAAHGGEKLSQWNPDAVFITSVELRDRIRRRLENQQGWPVFRIESL